ncbi:MAG: hypothetical protein ACXVHJ_37095, partial [Solirubrobacteraceae bacterium]
MFPVWGATWIVFVVQSAPSTGDRIPKQNLYLVKPSGAGLHRLTHIVIANQMFGFTPIAWSANGCRLIAEFNGTSTDYVVTVDARTGAVDGVGKPAGGSAGVSGAGISRDGSTILGVQESAGSRTESVVALPYRGGAVRVLARNAISPSWSK